MNLAELLIRTAAAAPDAPALAHGERTAMDFGALALASARLAGGLASRLELAPGDRVALIMKNGLDYVPLLFGCWHGGFAAVPVNAKLHAKEIAYILADSGARAAIATPDLAETAAAALAEAGTRTPLLVTGTPDFRRLGDADAVPAAAVSSDRLAWLFYTSGTTGKPKGAMLTHGNLMTMTLCYFADVDHIQPGDSILHAAPMSHGSGLYILPHVVQAAKQVIPESGGFDPGEICALLPRHRGVTMFAAPTMVQRLVDSPALATASLDNLKTIVYGGAPMYVADLKRALDRLGPRLVQIYGQGESPMTITALSRSIIADRAHPRWEARIASVGQRQIAVELMVGDSEDRPMPTGEAGEVLARGPSVMPGYWNKPEASAQTLRSGWLHTGDVGALDEDGFLTLKDRSKDLIISGGSNIYPREVEEVLLRHPGVAEVAVVGRPHPEWGEEVVAFVVARSEAKVPEAELDRMCLEAIARFKRPRLYRFVGELPKNNYGKVLKTALRGML
ncbi:MAG: AMP-binding protein [Proteobacteria bacterium]|nr:AMP-binding protein [Pseudomonadota bacterium]MBI3498033.1 AMP-binding protein [Pseudomonadota bacterium]